MAIKRWSPYRELMTMQNQLSKLWGDAWGDRTQDETEYGAWAPAVDLREEEERYVIDADLPGVKKEDIDINLENNVLTIMGERRFENESKKESYHCIERSYGKFIRSFTLPVRVSADKITATHKEGILEVVIPKAEESLPKKIKING